jgi:hypothetical protein
MLHRLALFSAFLALSCGSPGEATDAGPDVVYGHKPIDGGGYDAPVEAKTPDNRLKPHAGEVLSAPHVQAIYIGTSGVDMSKSFDGYMTWLLTSTGYWSILAQYNVGYGSFDGSSQVDTDAFFLPGMVTGGIIDWQTLDDRLQAVINGQAADGGVPEAGADAGDAGDDAGDAGDGGGVLPPIPKADAYVVFLPDGVNVDLGGGSATCVDAAGYHSFDGKEPYAIIPPCGRYPLVVSHEMAEMATDPLPGAGWYDDTDQTGGEIGDLCNFAIQVENESATALWSNKDGDCEPP